MNNDFIIYALALLAVVIGFLVLKKVASCLIKTIVLLVLIAIIAIVYFYLQQ